MAQIQPKQMLQEATTSRQDRMEKKPVETRWCHFDAAPEGSLNAVILTPQYTGCAIGIATATHAILANVHADEANTGYDGYVAALEKEMDEIRTIYEDLNSSFAIFDAVAFIVYLGSSQEVKNPEHWILERMLLELGIREVCVVQHRIAVDEKIELENCQIKIASNQKELRVQIGSEHYDGNAWEYWRAGTGWKYRSDYQLFWREDGNGNRRYARRPWDQSLVQS